MTNKPEQELSGTAQEQEPAVPIDVDWAAMRPKPVANHAENGAFRVPRSPPVIEATGSRNEKKLRGSRRILEMVATGAPLQETLDALMLFLETQEPGMRCGILIVTDDGEHFRRGSGPNLPEVYHDALDGVPITPPYLGSCGEAVHQCTAVEIPDVEQETRYSEDWRSLLLACGFRAARSTPIRGAENKVLGSLAMYFDRPRDPNPADPELVEMATHLAAIAIEHDRGERRLRESREQLAAELSGAKALQKVSIELIPEQHPETLNARILDAATSLMHSDAASIQMLDARGSRLELLAWKNFHPESAAFWEWVDAASGSTCGQALARNERVLVDDIETCGFMAGTQDLEEYRRSNIRAVQSTPLVSRSGHPLGMISTHWSEPHSPTERELGMFDVLARQAADMIERSQAETALRDSEERLRHIVDGASEYAIITLDAKGTIQSWNAGAERLLGYKEAEALGRPGDIFFTPEDRIADIPEKEMAAARTEGRASNERWHMRKDGSRFWGSGVMLPLEDDGQKLFLKIFRDRTEEREAENRQQILIHELNHRVKNTLATVQAIASQTLRGSKVESGVRQSFEARLQALASGHDVLTRESWGRVDLRRIVATALKPFRLAEKGRIQAEGPAFYVSPKISLAFTMALHELATNATKYGALSNETGRVEISWKVVGGEHGRLRFHWQESGGPPVAQPTRRGFGSRLIERSLAAELGAEVRIEYATQGVVCTFEAPVSQLWGSAPVEGVR